VTWGQYTLFDLTFRPARMSEEAMRFGFRELMKSVYSEERVNARRKIFQHCIRQSRT
jgi:hypothetical protein